MTLEVLRRWFAVAAVSNQSKIPLLGIHSVCVAELRLESRGIQSCTIFAPAVLYQLQQCNFPSICVSESHPDYAQRHAFKLTPAGTVGLRGYMFSSLVRNNLLYSTSCTRYLLELPHEQPLP